MSIRILQFFSMLENGGAENRMMDVYRHIDKSLVQFDFAVLHSGEQFFDREILNNGSKKYVLPDPRKGLIKNYVALVKFFRKHSEYKTVHAHLSWYSGIVLLAAKQAGTPIRIAHARDSEQKGRPLKTSIACKIGQLLIHLSATQKIAISKDAAANIFGNIAVKQKNYIFIPNSIDISKYCIPTEQEKNEIRERINIPTDGKAYVCVANLREQKNHTFLIDIAYELKKMDENFCLYLIGYGPLQEILENKVKQLNLIKNVHFFGLRDDVPSILGAFDAMIFPSLFEGLGGVVLEAQLVGIPSIVSDRIPDEADVGLGLVLKLSLELSAKQWADAIIRFSNVARCHREDIIPHFEEQGYTITNTTKRYLQEYGVPQEVIEKAIID